MRAKPRPCCRRVPSVLAKYLVSIWSRRLTDAVRTPGYFLNWADSLRMRSVQRCIGKLSWRDRGVAGWLFGEIVGLVLFRHLHLGVGLDLDETLGGGAVGAIGVQPEAAADGGDRRRWRWRRRR